MQIKQPIYELQQNYIRTITVLSGLFMFLVLFVYRAYHIDLIPAFSGHHLFFRALAHGISTSLVFYFVEYYFGRKLTNHLKNTRVITSLISIFIGLNFSFFIFNYFYNWTEMQWSSYLPFLYEYPLVLALPITISIIINNNFNRPSEWPTSDFFAITSQNKKEQFQIRFSDFLFVKSSGNYVEIYYQNTTNVKKRLIRKNLKDLEAENRLNPFLIRCHRSYFINTNNIDRINRQNHKMELSIAGITIPVSKKYEDKIL